MNDSATPTPSPAPAAANPTATPAAAPAAASPSTASSPASPASAASPAASASPSTPLAQDTTEVKKDVENAGHGLLHRLVDDFHKDIQKWGLDISEDIAAIKAKIAAKI